MSREGPRLSPVDYDAWNRGYMPPSEHVLIHELIHEGAKVLCSDSASNGFSWWLVGKGEHDIEELEFMVKSLEMQIGFLKEMRKKKGVAEVIGSEDQEPEKWHP